MFNINEQSCFMTRVKSCGQKYVDASTSHPHVVIKHDIQKSGASICCSNSLSPPGCRFFHQLFQPAEGIYSHSDTNSISEVRHWCWRSCLCSSSSQKAEVMFSYNTTGKNRLASCRRKQNRKGTNTELEELCFLKYQCISIKSSFKWSLNQNQVINVYKQMFLLPFCYIIDMNILLFTSFSQKMFEVMIYFSIMR